MEPIPAGSSLRVIRPTRGSSYGLDHLIGSANEAYALGFETTSGPGAADPAETLNLSFGSTATSDDEDDGTTSSRTHSESGKLRARETKT